MVELLVDVTSVGSCGAWPARALRNADVMPLTSYLLLADPIAVLRFVVESRLVVVKCVILTWRSC